MSEKRQRIPKEQSEIDKLEKLTNKRQRILKEQSEIDNPEKLTNKRQRKPKGQSEIDNPEKQATLGTQDEEKTQHNMCWTPLYANKHK